MRKNIYIMILVATISSFITVVCYWTINQKKYLQFNTSNINSIEVKKITYEPQGFAIRAEGLINDIISHETIKDIPLYEFTTGLSDHIKNNENTYKGVKINEVIKKINIDNYEKVIIKSTSGQEVEYNKNEIDDNIYLLFEKNSMPYPENEPVSFIDLKICDCYTIDSIHSIAFK